MRAQLNPAQMSSARLAAARAAASGYLARMAASLAPSSFLGILVAVRLQCHCNTREQPGLKVDPRDKGVLIMAIDNDKLHEFLGKFVTDLGATAAAGNVVIGHNLGLYKALAGEPASADELAARTGTDPRYVAEWLRGQAAGGYVEYDAATGSYSMTEEQAFALTNPDGGVYAPGAFVLALGTLKAVPRITEAFRTGAGLGWHPAGHGRLHRLRAVLPARVHRQPHPGLDPGARRRGGQAAGGSQRGRRRLRARRVHHPARPGVPELPVHRLGLPRPVDRAGPWSHAGDAGVTDRVAFAVASAATFPGNGYDLTATFDCLHDMGDPLAAAKHIRQALKPDGTWLIVEPYATDEVIGNMNPVGRVYYNFSTLLCVPNALSQSGGYALGAQAGEAAIRQVVTDAGFTRFRRATETPFNLVYEVRP